MKWEEAQERDFQIMQNLLCTKLILRLPDPLKTYTLSTDASNEGLGAVLMQECDGKLHLVSYVNKKLSSAEENNSIVEIECLAIVRSAKQNFNRICKVFLLCYWLTTCH